MNENLLVSIEEFEDTRKYWQEKLSGELNELDLQYDYKRTSEYRRGQKRLVFGKELSERILGVCKNQDLLLFMLSMAVMKVLLARYSGQNDIIISSPVYTTLEENYDYNKCIVFRDYIDDELSFKELLVNIRKTITEGYKNQHYPMENIFDHLEIQDLRPFLHRFIIYMENIHKSVDINDILDAPENHLTISIVRTEDGLEGSIFYNAALFREDTIERISKHYLYIFEQVMKDINIKLINIELLSEDEKQQLTVNFNNTEASCHMNKTITMIFEEQVEKTPSHPAVILENEVITYHDLNERANQLARVLKEKGLKTEGIVAIMADYSIELIVGIMGIMKAGGAYLPIDPGYPSDRVNYMLEDANVGIILTQQSLTSKISFNGETMYLDDSSMYNGDNANLKSPIQPENLAYVIYTSGSTGRPKGVMIEHRSLINFIDWRIKNYNFTPADRILQLISVSFDGFGANLYSAILSGGALVLPGLNRRGDFKFISGLIKRKNVTNMSVVPAMYRAILDNACEGDLKTLRMVVLAGERADSELIGLSRKIAGEILLINEYGPTENSITTTSLIGMKPDNVGVIGRPVADNKIFILDKRNRFVPEGVPGELCITGSSLSRGYLNNPELTSEKFVENPFADKSGSSYCQYMYKTGDIARWLSDGNIEYLGRKDFQVKIRGYRVELEEIEDTILKLGNSKQTVVLDREDKSGNRYICAYVVSDEKMDWEEMRESLSRKLPHYMVPSRFIQLENLPLTQNGKLDRKALPDPDDTSDTGALYKAPENETEKILAEIWSGVLNIEKIGIHNNFFDLGGNSMLLMQVNSRIEKHFPGCINITDLFEHTTICKLAKFIESKKIKKDNAAVIKYVTFPEGYFSRDVQESSNTNLRFEVSGQIFNRLKEISMKEKVELNLVMLSLYITLLAKITQKNRVILHTAIDKKEHVYSVEVDIEEVEDFSELVQLIDSYTKSMKGTCYTLDDILRMGVRKSDTDVLLMFCENGLLTASRGLLDVYDVVLESNDEENRICFTCEYDAGRLKGDMIEHLMSSYLKLAGVMVDHYEGES